MFSKFNSFVELLPHEISLYSKALGLGAFEYIEEVLQSYDGFISWLYDKYGDDELWIVATTYFLCFYILRKPRNFFAVLDDFTDDFFMIKNPNVSSDVAGRVLLKGGGRRVKTKKVYDGDRFQVLTKTDDGVYNVVYALSALLAVMPRENATVYLRTNLVGDEPQNVYFVNITNLFNTIQDVLIGGKGDVKNLVKFIKKLKYHIAFMFVTYLQFE